MTDHSVVIAGAGPTGLMLAGELALAGVDVVVVERRPDQYLDGSRAGGLHSRTIEVLDQRGIAERFLAAGQVAQTNGFAGIPLDIGDFPTRHNYGLVLWQREFEPILAQWVEELGVPIRRSCDVVNVAQDATGVDVQCSDGARLRARYLVGCDGGRSAVRRATGIPFVGTGAATSWLIAQAHLRDEPEVGMRPEGGGIGPVDRVHGGNPYGIVITQPVAQTHEPTPDELCRELIRVYGTDFGVERTVWISRFDDATLQAESYRSGHVLLAGDAAHIHPPQGGQGLNTGVQDAVNLGWKLALVVQGIAPDALLDTYHAERHPVGARVLHNTRAQVALAGSDPSHLALRATFTELLALDEPRRRIAGMMSALDLHYDLGGDHPLVGRRMPDLDLATIDGPTRVYTLLHDARPLLLDLTERGAIELGPWAERVRRVAATTDGPWELPVIGIVGPPGAVLVRPDGHVAWTGSATDDPLVVALTTWFGPA